MARNFKVNDNEVVNLDKVHWYIHEPAKDRITLYTGRWRIKFFGEDAQKVWDEITKAQVLAETAG